LFTVVYVLVGVGILLAFLSRVAGQTVDSHMNAHDAWGGRGLRGVAEKAVRSKRSNRARTGDFRDATAPGTPHGASNES
jgi:hypothetical protein